MFKVFFFNFGYFADRVFHDLGEAVSFVKDKGFEATIFRGSDPVMSFTGVTLSCRRLVDDLGG